MFGNYIRKSTHGVLLEYTFQTFNLSLGQIHLYDYCRIKQTICRCAAQGFAKGTSQTSLLWKGVIVKEGNLEEPDLVKT